MKIKYLFLILFIFMSSISISSPKIVNADELQDNINEQLDHLDLSELEEFINNCEEIPENINLIEYIRKLLSGEYNTDTDNIFIYILDCFTDNLKSVLPYFLSAISVCFICGILKKLREGFNNSGIEKIIYFVAFLSISLIIISLFLSVYKNTKNTIENIAKLTQIMSPIILTLMVTTGKVSASIYKPVVAFLSTSIINIIFTFILPIILLMFVFLIISNIDENLKMNKFVEVFQSIIKWVLGIIITVFSIFLSVQGITSATYDGISVKASKYVISNSIPIIGGFLRDGFDLVVAGSVLIKNSVGLVSIFAMFFLLIVPVIKICSITLLLKITGGIVESVYDKKISDFCISVSKCFTYMNVAILTVGFMFFITVLLMIFSANAFI